MLLLIISMAVIFFDSFAEYFNNLPRTRLPLHSKKSFYNCVRSVLNEKN